MDHARHNATDLRRLAWMIFIAGASVCTSLAFACANPFAVRIVVRILQVNAVAYAGLIALHRLAVGMDLLAPVDAPRAAAA